MLKIPQDRTVKLPLVVGIFFIALGFYFFESVGGFLGYFQEDILRWELEAIEAHPESILQDAYPLYTPQSAATMGLSRLHFFHGHGYLMVVSSFIFLLLIAIAPRMGPRTKAFLMWISLAAMLMYNIGWAVAGALIPYMGVNNSKRFSEFLFFAPFGLTIIFITAVITIVYGQEALRYILRRGSEYD